MKCFIVQFLILLISLISSVTSQTPTILEDIRQSYRQFDYRTVIQRADSALQDKTLFSTDELVHILELKAFSHYAESESAEARRCFIDILNMRSDYQPDPMRTSPKIISFFEQIKESNTPVVEMDKVPRDTTLMDTVYITRVMPPRDRHLLPSIILPGTGQWLNGNRRKGAILTSFSSVLLVTSIVMTADCLDKRRDYLNSVEPSQIESSYQHYNSAYKNSIALWISYAALWTYCQTDLLLFNRKAQVGVSFHPKIKSSGFYRIACHIQF